MPGRTEVEEKTATDHAAVRAALVRFHADTRNPHLGAWTQATLLPVLPVLLGAILIGLVPMPDVDPSRPPVVPQPDAPPPPTPSDIALATYGVDLRLALAVLLLVVVLVISFLSQRHLLRTHAGAFWQGPSRGFRRTGTAPLSPTPPLHAGVWLALGLGLGLLAIAHVDHVFPWITPPPLPRGPNGFSAMPPETFWPLALGCALIAITFAVTALSAYAIRITWHNYPAVRHAERLVRDLRDAHAGKVVEDHLSAIASAWNEAPCGQGIIPVNSRMTPSQIVELLKTFLRPLVLVLILGLLTLSLFFDSLEARHDWSASVTATHDVWLIVFGILSSTVVAAIYLPAMSRLSLYLEAEEHLKSGSGGGTTGWRIARGEGAEAGQRLIVPRERKGPDPFPKQLADYLGGDRTKVAILLTSWHFAGGFHILLKQSLAKQVVTVLGLLGPTLAGTILAQL